MTTTFKPLPGTTNQAITITLNSLAASPTVGRQSTVIDNRTNLYERVMVGYAFKFATGTAGANKQVGIYAAGTADDTNYFAEYIAAGSGQQSTLGTTDASYTRADPSGLIIAKTVPIPFVASATTNALYEGVFTLDLSFGGMLPAQWALIVMNDTGVAFHSSGCSLWYQGFQGQGV